MHDDPEKRYRHHHTYRRPYMPQYSSDVIVGFNFQEFRVSKNGTANGIGHPAKVEVGTSQAMGLYMGMVSDGWAAGSSGVGIHRERLWRVTQSRGKGLGR